jgi:hypothetical protein
MTKTELTSKPVETDRQKKEEKAKNIALWETDGGKILKEEPKAKSWLRRFFFLSL